MTATLDLTDLEASLNHAPGCEREDCDSSATSLARLWCGCSTLLCGPCVETVVRRIARIVPHRMQCARCQADRDCAQVSDVLTVVSL